MTSRNVFRALLCAGALGVLIPSPRHNLGAQVPDRAAAFLHGLMDTSAVWWWAGSQLSQEFAINPTYASLADHLTYAQQASILNQQLPSGSWADGIAIGHSNGGIVSRFWDRNHGSRPKYILTVGSANRGAKLAQVVLDSSIVLWPWWVAVHTTETINATVWFEYIRANRSIVPIIYAAQLALHEWINMWLSYGSALLLDFGYTHAAEAAANYPVLFELPPTAPTFNGSSSINSPENLTREAASTDARVGIRGHYGWPGNIFINTILARRNPEPWRFARWFAYVAASRLQMHYLDDFDVEDPYYYDAQALAWEWMIVAGHVANVDVWWLDQIGALPGHQNEWGQYYWLESDGILPDLNQQYPGATAEYIADSVTHLLEPESPNVLDQLRVALDDDFAILRRSDIASSVVVSPDQVTLPPGTSQSFTATVLNAAGAPVNRPVSWTSSNTSVATVNAEGLASAISVGSVTLVAAIDGKSDTASLVVEDVLTGVTINGPISVRSGQMCTWVATPSGGSDHTYSWFRNGASVATGPQHTYSASAPFTLKVVAQAGGVSKEHQLTVTVSPSAPICFD